MQRLVRMRRPSRYARSAGRCAYPATQAAARSDSHNCGACGASCSSNNTTPSCASGHCTSTCSVGLGDCNNDLAGDGGEQWLSRTSASRFVTTPMSRRWRQRGTRSRSRTSPGLKVGLKLCLKLSDRSPRKKKARRLRRAISLQPLRKSGVRGGGLDPDLAVLDDLQVRRGLASLCRESAAGSVLWLHSIACLVVPSYAACFRAVVATTWQT